MGMMILLNNIVPAENRNRWYMISVQATLFQPCAVIVAWGRRDNDFQQWRVIPMTSKAQADQLANKIIERKLKRGYTVCLPLTGISGG
jgi:predicted DNA-binding WGR domain protein